MSDPFTPPSHGAELDSRSTLVPPAIAPHVGTPAGVAAPPIPRPASQRPAAVPTSVMWLDRAGEIAGIAAVWHLAAHGRLDAGIAVIAIGAILGVQTGIRTAGSRAAAATAATGAGLGAVGLFVWHAWPALTTVAVLLGRARGLAVVALAALTSHPR